MGNNRGFLLKGETGETERKILEIKNVQIDKSNALRRKDKSINDWRDMIDHLFQDEDKLDEILIQLDDFERKGIDPNTKPEWVRMAHRLTRIQSNKKIANRDDVTVTASMILEPFKYEQYDNFNRSPSDFITPFTKGMFGVITGVGLGSGKTDFACSLMEMALNLDNFNTVRVGKQSFTLTPFEIITNIRMSEPVKGVHYCTKMSDLILKCLEMRGKYIIFLDEASIFFLKKRSMSNKNIWIENLMRLIRKLDGSWIFITQDLRSVPTLVGDLKPIKYHKIKKDTVEIDIDTPHFQFHKVLGNVKPTKMPFLTKDIATLMVDVDTDMMYQTVGNATGQDQREVIRKFILSNKEKISKQDEEDIMRHGCQSMYVDGASPKEIIDAIGVSKTTLYRWIKEGNWDKLRAMKEKGIKLGELEEVR